MLEVTSSIPPTASTRHFSLLGPDKRLTFCLSIYSQEESSEEFLGEWMEKRGIRDQIVIATKVGILLSIFGSLMFDDLLFALKIVYNELQAIGH